MRDYSNRFQVVERTNTIVGISNVDPSLRLDPEGVRNGPVPVVRDRGIPFWHEELRVKKRKGFEIQLRLVVEHLPSIHQPRTDLERRRRGVVPGLLVVPLDAFATGDDALAKHLGEARPVSLAAAVFADEERRETGDVRRRHGGSAQGFVALVKYCTDDVPAWSTDIGLDGELVGRAPAGEVRGYRRDAGISGAEITASCDIDRRD